MRAASFAAPPPDAVWLCAAPTASQSAAHAADARSTSADLSGASRKGALPALAGCETRRPVLAAAALRERAPRARDCPPGWRRRAVQASTPLPQLSWADRVEALAAAAAALSEAVSARLTRSCTAPRQLTGRRAGQPIAARLSAPRGVLKAVSRKAAAAPSWLTRCLGCAAKRLLTPTTSTTTTSSWCVCPTRPGPACSWFKLHMRHGSTAPAALALLPPGPGRSADACIFARSVTACCTCFGRRRCLRLRRRSSACGSAHRRASPCPGTPTSRRAILRTTRPQRVLTS
jgi:hypothetical protein